MTLQNRYIYIYIYVSRCMSERDSFPRTHTCVYKYSTRKVSTMQVECSFELATKIRALEQETAVLPSMGRCELECRARDTYLPCRDPRTREYRALMLLLFSISLALLHNRRLSSRSAAMTTHTHARSLSPLMFHARE